MSDTQRGLYERLLTEALDAQLGALGHKLEASRTDLPAAEAAERLALHLSRVLERAVESLDTKVRARSCSRCFSDSKSRRALACFPRRLLRQAGPHVF